MLFKSKGQLRDKDTIPPKKKSDANTQKKKRSFFYYVLRVLHLIFLFIKNTFMVVLLIGFIVTAIVSMYILNIIYDLPSIDPFTIQDGLIESSLILDDKGQIIQTLYGDYGKRSTIEYHEISQDLINGIIAIEDKTFFDHQGFNYTRLLGAVYESITSDDSIRGTSSITQQLAKNMYLTNERAIERKIKEAYYTIFLERSLSKEQILEAYLNKINLGMQANGVASAADQYFSKDAKDLNLIESAILAGIPKAPSYYAPIKRLLREDIKPDHQILDASDDLYTLIFNPISQNRYNTVIQQMYNNQMITEDVYNRVYDIDISKYIHPRVNETNDITSYFGDMIKDDVVKALAKKDNISEAQAERQLYERGYIIHSTIDFDMQKAVESIYNQAQITNVFDEATLSALMHFQEDHDLEMDGLLGPITLDELFKDSMEERLLLEEENHYYLMVHQDMLLINQRLDALGYLSNDNLFPSVVAMFNEDKNIVNDETLKVILYKYDNVIDEDKQLRIPKTHYYFNEEDDLILKKDGVLSFYQQTDRVQVVVKKLFKYDETSEKERRIDKKDFTAISGLYIFTGGDVLIHDDYKSKVDGDLVVDRQFMKDYPNFFTVDDSGDLLVDERDYIVSDRGQIQPQSAFVIIDQSSGEIKAIVGGRDAFGANIYNRALVPHQPGSSIKPIGPYTVAIESRKWTAASVIDDLPVYLNKDAPNKRWPINWYEDSFFKYRGRKNLRQGIEDSLNVVTAKLTSSLGVKPIMDQLENLGVSTLVEEDRNIAAMALGGMTYGISPLEMTAAYATYANQGLYIEPISFSKITDKSGKIIINNSQEKSQVLEAQVAFIIQDMMRTAVSHGYARKAQIRENNLGIPIAGKTGTTSDKRDALFMGYSPYYTAAVWFGNDIRLKMDEGSGIAAEFWQLVMSKVHENYEEKDFVEPEGLIRASVDRVSGKRPSELSDSDPAGSQVYEEIFLPGTVPLAIDDSHVQVEICRTSNLLARPNCEETDILTRRTRLEAYDYSLAVADQAYMVPGLCGIPGHQDSHQEVKLLKTESVGLVVFTRDYRLLLKDQSFIVIPKDSRVDVTDHSITFPNGFVLEGSLYNIDYIVHPETQIEAIDSLNN